MHLSHQIGNGFRGKSKETDELGFAVCVGTLKHLVGVESTARTVMLQPSPQS